MTSTIHQVDQLTTNKMPQSPNTVKESKMKDYRAHLRTITNGLVEMAKAAGREEYTCNQLLRECYNLTNSELMTYEQWKEQGAYVRRGEHAYLFWGTPVTTKAGYTYWPVEFRFCREQVRFKD
ncbi:MAG: hypothetical protein J6R26_09045 [Paludibacteraceae bacterium]|jgi:hypothetical protein|nr:hypothetical protein [Paludibacteraceae bacterium]